MKTTTYLLLVFWLLTSCNQPPPSRETLAVRTCYDFVLTKLKAPATAKFPPADEARIEIDQANTSKWNVYSYVDAENSFGAMLRMHYRCRMEWREATWHMLALTYE
jgi:hypothetical protein